MNKELFREKSLERLNSPDEFDKYVKVSTPGTWILIAGIVLIVIGIFVWGILGDIPTYISVGVLQTESGKTYCLIDDEDYKRVSEGMTVEVDGKEYPLTNLSDYDAFATVQQIGVSACEAVGMQDSGWIYMAEVEGFPQADDVLVFKGRVMVEDIQPFSFIFN